MKSLLAVAAIAAREHVSLDAAARGLLRQAARTLQVSTHVDDHDNGKETPAQVLARLKKSKSRRIQGFGAPMKGDIIGLLGDDPEGVELIRRAASERRRATYDS